MRIACNNIINWYRIKSMVGFNPAINCCKQIEIRPSSAVCKIVIGVKKRWVCTAILNKSRKRILITDLSLNKKTTMLN